MKFGWRKNFRWIAPSIGIAALALGLSLGVPDGGCGGVTDQTLVHEDGTPVDENKAGPRSPHSLASSAVSVPTREQVNEAPPIAPPPEYPPPLPPGGINGDRPERSVPGL